MSKIIGVLGALLLPLCVVLFGTGTLVGSTATVGCKKEAACGECQWKYLGNCEPCSYRRGSAEAFLSRNPQCCGCPADENALEDYGIEEWVCPNMDTDAPQENPYDTAADETTGDPPGEESSSGGELVCEGNELWDLRGYVLGVYRDNAGTKRWHTLPAGNQFWCLRWGDDPDQKPVGDDLVFPSCGGSADEAIGRAQSLCNSTWAGAFPPTAGGCGAGCTWTFDHAYCYFGPGAAVPAAQGGGANPCYGYGSGDGMTADPTSAQCDPEDANQDPWECPMADCTNWNNTSHVSSPAFNIGFTADTTYSIDIATGARVFDNHRIKVDDDFWPTLVSTNLGTISLCDGPEFDTEENELNGTFNTGDLLKEAGFSSVDYDLEGGATSTGPWFDLGSQWMEAYYALKSDNEIYIRWKRTCIGCGAQPYAIHRAKVTIAECAAINPCPNP